MIKLWICSGCKRAYPQYLDYCPKCNISQKNQVKELMEKHLKEAIEKW